MSMTPNLWIYQDLNQVRKAYSGLITFSAEIFKEAKIIKELPLLKKIVNERLSSPYLSTDDLNQIIPPFIFEYVVDCVRILIFFENFMKAKLISKGVCVYKINKDNTLFKLLAKEQYKRPVTMKEIADIEPFVENISLQQLTHPALLDQTITISQMITSASYLAEFSIPEDIIEIISKMNQQRNKLHLNIEADFELSLSFIEKIEKLNDFVNDFFKANLKHDHNPQI